MICGPPRSCRDAAADEHHARHFGQGLHEQRALDEVARLVREDQ